MLSLLDEFVTAWVDDPLAGFAVGTFGAIAEFLHPPGVTVTVEHAPGRHTAVCDDGALRLDLHDGTLTPRAWRRPVGTDDWTHAVALCLPDDRAAGPARTAVTVLGDDPAPLVAPGTLVDLGLGVAHLEACIRTDDRALIDRCARASTLDGDLVGAVVASGATRVFRTAIARIEVCTPIPPPDGGSPLGPHTHLLPDLLAHRRTHAATDPIPDGEVPVASVFPPHPHRDALGREHAWTRRRTTRSRRRWRRSATPTSAPPPAPPAPASPRPPSGPLHAVVAGSGSACPADTDRPLLGTAATATGSAEAFPVGPPSPAEVLRSRCRRHRCSRTRARATVVAVTTIPAEDPLAVAATEAVQQGDLPRLRRLLDEHPGLAAARIGSSEPGATSRTLLHAATDWPGHRPGVAATIALLVERGADVDARFAGPHEETPLHWAASCDDVEAVDALLDAGADLEAPGAVLGGGTPIADARGFKQWAAAERLLARGATTTLVDAATLGLDDRVRARLADGAAADEIAAAFWGACHGGRRTSAELLRAAGADVDRVPPWTSLTPLDAAREEGADDLVAWLRAQGARSATELPG